MPVEHWSIPKWIDNSRFIDSLDYLGTIGVGKGWMVSYRHMCRWNSGFFYKHPRLQDYDFYWRVEPDVHFFCDIDYDIFRFMRDNRLKYGFTMNILDDARSFPSLWSETREFMNARPELLHPDADLEWLIDEQGEYNNCQFFSNFEIGYDSSVASRMKHTSIGLTSLLAFTMSDSEMPQFIPSVLPCSCQRTKFGTLATLATSMI